MAIAPQNNKIKSKMKSNRKILGTLLFIIGFIVTVVFLVKCVSLVHPYLGWIIVGSVCMFIGTIIYEINSEK